MACLSELVAQVEGFRSGEVVIAQDRERAASSAVLDTSPRKLWIKVIAPVHEDRSGLQPTTYRSRCLQVRGPDRCGQAEVAVVHQSHGFVVGTGDLSAILPDLTLERMGMVLTVELQTALPPGLLLFSLELDHGPARITVIPSLGS
mgnify:CR=1 FL=1